MGSSSSKLEYRMEVAGASKLSTSAELATRELDSADEEPELPSAVQDTIWLLEGKNIRVSEAECYETYVYRMFCPIIGRPEFEDFFPKRAPLSTNTGWRSQLRLRVLEAIGSYSFKGLNVEGICGRHISRLTTSEWEIALKGFRSSSVLREIRIGELTWNSEAELESLFLQLGIILNTSSVTDLTIYNCGLTARCFLNIASRLREHSKSELKSLKLLHAWEDASVVKYVVEMLNGDNRLETLCLGSYLSYMYDVDEAAVRTLSQALMQNTSLTKLALDEVKGGSAALLLKAFAGDEGNRSIERLEVMAVYTIGKCLPELFISNRSLRVVILNAITMPREECRLLGEAIRENATATTVYIRNYIPRHCFYKGGLLVGVTSYDEKRNTSNLFATRYDGKVGRHTPNLGATSYDEKVRRDTPKLGATSYKGISRYTPSLSGFLLEGLEELACAASSDVKEPVLHLEIRPRDQDEVMLALKLLSSVLRGEIKSIKSFRLHTLDFPTPISGLNHNYESVEGILPMNGKTGETSVLNSLHLATRNENISKGIWKQLLWFLRGNTSVTSLSLEFFRLDQEEFRELMGLLQVNLTLEKINVWQTP